MAFPLIILDHLFSSTKHSYYKLIIRDDTLHAITQCNYSYQSLWRFGQNYFKMKDITVHPRFSKSQLSKHKFKSHMAIVKLQNGVIPLQSTGKKRKVLTIKEKAEHLGAYSINRYLNRKILDNFVHDHNK